MTASVESKSFRMERLLRDSQNIQTTKMGQNEKANGNATKGMGQKRKATTTTMDNGIETKRQAMEESKANCAVPNAQPIQSASSSTPSATVSTAAPIPPKVPFSSTFPKLPMAPIFPHQPFPPFLPPPCAFVPPFYSTPTIRGATTPQQFPSPAIPNPFLVAAILHQQQIAQQQQQAQATAAFLQQMFMMSPMSNLSAAGTPSSSNVGSSGGTNSSAGGSLGRGNGSDGNGNPGMAFRIPKNGQMNLAANAMENRDKLIGNGANLETPKIVQQRGKRPAKVDGQNAVKKEEVVATCEYCGKTFERYWLLNGHIRTHTGDKPFDCNWPGCGKKFADRSNCRAHERTHRPEKPFACPTCPKSFKLKSYLTKHVRAKVCNPGAKMMRGNENGEGGMV